MIRSTTEWKRNYKLTKIVKIEGFLWEKNRNIDEFRVLDDPKFSSLWVFWENYKIMHFDAQNLSEI